MDRWARIRLRTGVEITEEDIRKIDNHEWMRAGGECICIYCFRPYLSHPRLKQVEWLNRLCDGKLVKL